MTGGRAARPGRVPTRPARTLVVLPSNGLVNLKPALATNLRVPGRHPGAQRRRLEPGRQGRRHHPPGRRRRAGAAARARQRHLRRGVLDERAAGRPFTQPRRGRATSPATSSPTWSGKTATGPMTIFPGNGTTGFQAPCSLRPRCDVQPDRLRAAGSRAHAGVRVHQLRRLVRAVHAASAAATSAGYDWVIGPGDVDGDGVADLVARDARRHAVAAARAPSTGYARRARFIGRRLRRLLARRLSPTLRRSSAVARSSSRRAGQRRVGRVAQQHQRPAVHQAGRGTPARPAARRGARR